jgi:uncharacterized protein YukE
MPSPSQIQRKTVKINNVNVEISRGKDRCQRYTYNSTSWWQSEAGKELRSRYSGIQAKIAKLMYLMDGLENSTRRLSDRVERAREERREKHGGI